MSSSTSDTWRPSTPISLIAGTPPGGGQDRAARALAAAVTASTGIAVDVSNLPGRGGGVAWSSVAGQPGRTDLLSVSSPTLLTNAIRASDEPGIGDLTHLALLCTEYIVFVAPTDGPLTTASDLLATLGTDPGSLVVALATALGNVNHVAVSMVARHVGTPPGVLDVRAFGSARTAVGEVVEGRASVAAVSAASTLPELRAGTVRALAVSSPSPLEGALDGVPAWVDLSVPCEIGTWRGVVAPSALPDSALAFWDDCLREAITQEAWRAALEDHLWTDTYLPWSAATRFVTDEDGRLGAALRELGMVDG